MQIIQTFDNVSGFHRHLPMSVIFGDIRFTLLFPINMEHSYLTLFCSLNCQAVGV